MSDWRDVDRDLWEKRVTEMKKKILDEEDSVTTSSMPVKRISRIGVDTTLYVSATEWIKSDSPVSLVDSR